MLKDASYGRHGRDRRFNKWDKRDFNFDGKDNVTMAFYHMISDYYQYNPYTHFISLRIVKDGTHAEPYWM